MGHLVSSFPVHGRDERYEFRNHENAELGFKYMAMHLEDPEKPKLQLCVYIIRTCSSDGDIGSKVRTYLSSHSFVVEVPFYRAWVAS